MRPVRIANFSGFYGDRLAAPREMLDGGPIDFLTGDYLAELTLMILWKARRKDPSAGYATTFLRQMEYVLGDAIDRGVKIVSDAGGLNPAGLAEQLRELAGRLGIDAKIAHIEGDDLMGRLELPPEALTANAYLGSWGIVEALERGADVVVCPRVTDAALTVGPAAWWHKWEREDWDRLASAVVAGHVIECGAQATGGNYPFFSELGDMRAPGFPIAEVAADGTAVITKHPGHGGAVTAGTVTAQLLYEIAGPRYLSPDVVARFDTIRLSEDGPDRVRIAGVRGEPSPPETKVCVNASGGYRNSMTFVMAGLDFADKVELTRAQLAARLGEYDTLDIQAIPSGAPDPGTNEAAFGYLRVVVKDRDRRKAGRAFSSACVELALAGYPGFFATTPPQGETEYAIYSPAFVPADLVEEVVVAPGGERIPIPQARGGAGAPVEPPAFTGSAPGGPTRPVPLGLVAGARSGDKGGDANCGVWARSDAGYGWLREYLTVERLRELLPEARELEIDRYELPNLRALNFVLKGLLGEGVMSSTRMDPQAKSLGEYLRAKVVDVPEELL